MSTLTGVLSRAQNISGMAHRYFPTPEFLLPRACGIDISDASIKWMTLSRGEPFSRQVTAWGELPLTPGVVVGGIVHDVQALSEALAHVAPQLGGVGAAHAALPEEAAYVFDMSVPQGTPLDQILSMIEFEFDGRVPIPPSAAVYNFNVIQEHENGTDEEISVVVFPREVSETYAAAFAGAGFQLLSLEIEARSIARAVSSSEASEPITLLIDFGRARTGFAVLKRGIPIFTSTVELGGDAATKAVQKALSVTPDEAQHFANFEGLLQKDGKKSSGTEAIVGTASALADETARHYRYWDTRRNEHGERVTPVGKIVLVGGGANMNGLPEYIAGRVQAPVERGNIWRHITGFADYIPPIDRRTSLQFATAAGLALRDI